MKRLYTQAKWKKLSRTRQHNEEVRRRRHKSLPHLRNVYHKGVLRGRNAEWSRLTAPTHFSFIENTEEMIAYFDAVREEFRRGKNVELDLSGVTRMTSDAIAVLLSKMPDPRFSFGMEIGGNAPEDSKAKEVFVGSGFFRFVRSRFVRMNQDYGSVSKRVSKRVEPVKAQELVAFASKFLFGATRHCYGAYRTLLECMANTRMHASKLSIEYEMWWASAYYDQQANKVNFTFVDNGVGIFNSIRMKTLTGEIARTIGILDRPDILRDLLHGKIGSRTRLPYRGKGLPGMFADLQRGLISNLTVITNNVKAHVSQDRFAELARPFYGTLIYWELKGEPGDQRKGE